MNKGRNRLLIGFVAASMSFCGVAYGQEAGQPRDVELGQTVYRTNMPGSMTIERDMRREFIDGISGSDHSLADDARQQAAVHSSQGSAQSSFMADALGSQSDPVSSLVQDYIDRTSNQKVFRYQ